MLPPVRIFPALPTESAVRKLPYRPARSAAPQIHGPHDAYEQANAHGQGHALKLRFEQAEVDRGECPAPRSRNRAGHHPQPVAERPAARQAQQLRGDERPVDAEQARNLLRRAVQAGAIVLNKVAVLRTSGPTPTKPAPASSALSTNSFRTSRRKCFCGTPAFWLSVATVRNSVQSGRSNWMAPF